MRRTHRWYGIFVGLIVSMAIPPLLAGPRGGGNPNPGVAPIESHTAGKSYSDWVQAWWTWAISIPAATNPIVDETGAFGAIGQSGHVWFLAGNFGGACRTVLTPRRASPD